MNDPRQYQNNHSQATKAAMLKQDKAASTFSQRTANDIALESRGRFGGRQPQIIGENAPTYPKASDWVGQDRGQELPFPVDINAMEPVGTQAEIAASLKRVESASTATPRTEERAGAKAQGRDPSAASPDVEPTLGQPSPRRPVHFEDD